MIICIPGPWKDRRELQQKVMRYDPAVRYTFMMDMLTDLTEQDHVTIDVCARDPNLMKAFRIGGQGKVPAEVLQQIEGHESVVYLHFPLDLTGQRERILKYTRIIQALGGMAVKVESAGVAHTWERWYEMLSGTPFDLYCSAVVLVGDEEHYYSCGMHHFGLPDCEVPRALPGEEAADLINRFNFWQIVEAPASPRATPST